MAAAIRFTGKLASRQVIALIQVLWWHKDLPAIHESSSA